MVPYALFLLLQYHAYGWYFHPDHVGFLVENWAEFKVRGANVTNWAFVRHNRRILVWGLGLGIALTLFLRRREGIGTILRIHILDERRRYLLLFILIYAIFSIANFFSVRYLIPMLGIFALLVWDWMNAAEARPYLHSLLLAPTFWAILLENTRHEQNIGDVTLGYLRDLKVQQAGIAWLRQNVPTTAHIGTQDYLVTQQLKNYRAGMLNGPEEEYSQVAWEIDNTKDFAIFTSNEHDKRRAELLEKGYVRLLQRFEDGKAWWEVYAIVR
jgi:hypothetical protein